MAGAKSIFCFFLLFASCKMQAAEIEGRIGGFLPQSRLFREIYGTVIPSYQLQTSWNFPDCLKLWGNLAYSNALGHSVPFGTKVKLHMVPISLGPGYFLPLPKSFEFFVGAGACYTWLKETNRSEFIPRSNTAHGFGGIIKIHFSKKVNWFVASVFADYLLQTATAKNSTGKTRIDLSGLFFGCGIGGSY